MGNHVIYDKLWESDRLTECSRDAALAYPWIFLVADDHGRFEYRPRRIWSKVFGARPDITLEEVTDWLRQYWSVGLLERFGPRGDLAVWHNFSGRRPSERRPSALKDPKTLQPFTEGRGSAAEDPRRCRDDAAEDPRQNHARDRAEIEQSRDRAEQSGTDLLAAPPPPERHPKLSKSKKPAPATLEATTGCDDLAEIMGGQPEYSAPVLRLFDRLHREGRTREQWRAVLLAYRDGSTSTARFCRDGNGSQEGGPGLTYLLRPGEKGGFDSVWLQTREPPGRPPPARAAPGPMTAGERTMAAAKRFIERGMVDGDREGGVREGSDEAGRGLQATDGRHHHRGLLRGSGG